MLPNPVDQTREVIQAQRVLPYDRLRFDLAWKVVTDAYGPEGARSLLWVVLHHDLITEERAEKAYFEIIRTIGRIG